MVDWAAAGLTPAAITSAVTDNVTDLVPIVLLMAGVTLAIAIVKKIRGVLRLGR
jgi:hypothetical protein